MCVCVCVYIQNNWLGVSGGFLLSFFTPTTMFSSGDEKALGMICHFISLHHKSLTFYLGCAHF